MRERSELVEWLRAQLDEDERVAREVPAGDGDSTLFVLDDDYRHDKIVISRDRVLRGVETKRRILAEVIPMMDGMDEKIDEEWNAGEPVSYSSPILLRLMALPYCDRPGYREEWRPT
jgi:hypothetical protein